MSSNIADFSQGGAIAVEVSAKVHMESCSISKNRAFQEGGAAMYISGSASVLVQSTSIFSNDGRSSGGTYVCGNANLLMHTCRVWDNQAFIYGGGFYVTTAASVRIELCALYNNRAGGDGAGFYVTERGNVFMQSCVIFDNNAHGYGSSGGGLYMTGSADTQVQSSSIFNNYAQGSGGAMYGSSNARLNLTSTTFGHNHAGSHKGNALYWDAQSTDYLPSAFLSNCTFRDHNFSTVMAILPVAWYCPLGKYSPSTGGIPRNNFASTHIIGCAYECPEGRFGTRHDIETSEDCDLCPKGQYCDATGLSAGLDCPPGTRMPAKGSSLRESCIPCAPGQFNNQPGQENCNPCSAGSYSEALGVTSCTACAAGGYCPEAEGGAFSRLVFQPCPSGTWSDQLGSSDNSSCTSCLVGKASNREGATSPSTCQLCRAGSMAPVLGMEDCNPCNPGTYQNEVGATECKPCTDGYYCPQGAATPLPCPGGTTQRLDFTMISTADCVICTEGTFCPVGSKAAIDCSAGTYNDQQMRETCDPCPAGRFQDAEGATACKPCEGGHYCPNAAAAALPCRAGYFSDSTNLTKRSECIPASPGFFSLLGSTCEQPCSTGEFSGAVHAPSCDRCSDGTFQDEPGQSACHTCQAGFWCTAEQAIPCAEDTFQPLTNQFVLTACKGCSLNSTTNALRNCSSVASCVCRDGYYEHNATRKWITGEIDCRVCPSGSDCPKAGVTLETMPIKRGYFRLSKDSIDIRRCPDAAAGCSNKPECEESHSGCAGSAYRDEVGSDFMNTDAALCLEGLTGPFCLLCNESDASRYYAAATDQDLAQCPVCNDTAHSTTLLFVGFLFCMAAALNAGQVAFHRYLSEHRKAQLSNAWTTLAPHNKLRISVGLYQIITQMEKVYGVEMPPTVKQFLSVLATGVSFGFNSVGSVLECFNFRGFRSTLTLYIVAPLIVAAFILIGTMFYTLCSRRSTSVVLEIAATPLLLLAFITYPLVATKAFEAFSCYQFSSDRYLKADVAIQCDTTEHDGVKQIAWVAILLYPCGLLAVNALLLFRARHAILSQRPSALSTAIGFLHRQYEPHFFWWEICEMLRRFVLVGVMVLLQDNIMQLIIGMLLATAFLLFQAQAAPYVSMADDLLASMASFCLVVVFVSSIAFKYTVLIDLPDIQIKMSSEQRSLYVLNHEAQTIITIMAAIGALVASATIFVLQLFAEQERRRREALASKARRLRYMSNNKEVEAPAIGTDEFHLFLSHVWGSAQAQVRIIKQRLCEMIPSVKVWLDVDDLQEIGNLEGYINAVKKVLIYCSKGYFDSKNCVRELIAAAKRGKPVIAIVDLDESRDGLSLQQVHEQVLRAADHYEEWGIEVGAPHGQELFDHLFTIEPIEWNYIGHFQDVTMRLIAERLLPSNAIHATYVDNEITRRPSKPLPPPRASFHVYCSAFNLGALALMKEVAHELGLLLREGETSQDLPSAPPAGVLCVTSDKGDLPLCDHMLLYLTSQTWTTGESPQLASEVEEARTLGVHVLLTHEMRGVGGQDQRDGCDFGVFFACAQGSTPEELLKGGVYSEIAVPLKGGSWRKASMALLGLALAMTKEQADDAAAGIDILNVGDKRRSRYVKKISAKMIRVAIQRSSRRSTRDSGAPRTPSTPRTPRKSSNQLRRPTVDSVSVASSTTELAPSSAV